MIISWSNNISVKQIIAYIINKSNLIKSTYVMNLLNQLTIQLMALLAFGLLFLHMYINRTVSSYLLSNI